MNQRDGFLLAGQAVPSHQYIHLQNYSRFGKGEVTKSEDGKSYVELAGGHWISQYLDAFAKGY